MPPLEINNQALFNSGSSPLTIQAEVNLASNPAMKLWQVVNSAEILSGRPATSLSSANRLRLLAFDASGLAKAINCPSSLA